MSLISTAFVHAHAVVLEYTVWAKSVWGRERGVRVGATCNIPLKRTCVCIMTIERIRSMIMTDPDTGEVACGTGAASWKSASVAGPKMCGPSVMYCSVFIRKDKRSLLTQLPSTFSLHGRNMWPTNDY